MSLWIVTVRCLFSCWSIGKWRNNSYLSDSPLYNLKPGTQQYDIVLAFEFPTLSCDVRGKWPQCEYGLYIKAALIYIFLHYHVCKWGVAFNAEPINESNKSAVALSYTERFSVFKPIVLVSPHCFHLWCFNHIKQPFLAKKALINPQFAACPAAKSRQANYSN